jgi:hypothetical protein
MEVSKGYAKKLLATYPDYGKATEGYVLAVIEVFSTYGENVLIELVNARTGLPAKCKFLPTIAEIVEFAEPLNRAFNPEKSRGYRIDRSYKAQQVPYNDRMNGLPKSRDLPEPSKASIVNADSWKAFANELGNGDESYGWLLIVQQGIERLPPEYEARDLPF